MQEILPQYNDVIRSLEPMLLNLPFKVIGIDGSDGVGKTTLGRFLAWHFNITLVETDNFRTEVTEDVRYRSDCIRQEVNARQIVDRPVILDGIALLDLVRQLSVPLHFHIYVEHQECEGSHALEATLRAYREQYRPKEKANVCIQISV